MTKFTIFRENNRWVQIPTSKGFLKRLVGINIYQRKKETVVEPVYLPVIYIERGSLTQITVSWDEPLFTVVIASRYPFIVFLKAIKNEDIDGGVE